MGLTPERMLAAYRRGIFPMAEARDSDVLHWVEPRRRGIFPLDGFHVSRSLRRAILRADYQITTDRAFAEVVAACGDRDETWINEVLIALYDALHRMGHAHSLEVWRDGRLIGGVFGLTFGRVFCGETMFSRERDASKIALTYLVDRLQRAGFALFDTQFLTPHLASLGAIDIPQTDYLALLKEANSDGEADFGAVPLPQPPEVLSGFGAGRAASPAEAAGAAPSGRMQRSTQIS